jgi:hypothetical protein
MRFIPARTALAATSGRSYPRGAPSTFRVVNKAQSLIAGGYRSSTSVESRSDTLNTSPRDPSPLFIKVSDLRRSLSSALWSVACLRLVCSRVRAQKKAAIAGLTAAPSLKRGTPHVGDGDGR